MSYTSKDIKNIVAEILENKKDKGGVKSLYFVGCGGSRSEEHTSELQSR